MAISAIFILYIEIFRIFIIGKAWAGIVPIVAALKFCLVDRMLFRVLQKISGKKKVPGFHSRRNVSVQHILFDINEFKDNKLKLIKDKDAKGSG